MIPCLNRDGDLLSDLVLPLFGSIAGAESVLLALDDELAPRVAMAEAPHGTAPALEGKGVANPMAMILAGGAAAALRGGEAERASRAVYECGVRDGRGRDPDPRSGRALSDDRVHRRRDREPAPQARHLSRRRAAERSAASRLRFARPG